MNAWHNSFAKCARRDKNILIIDFKKMVSDMDQFKGICAFVGIDDMDWELIKLDRVINYSKKRLYEEWEDMPIYLRQLYNKLFWDTYE